ncbi:MAG: LuxR family transcriptional regulator [Thermoleophilia bacterium]|nr:LuxR family transcriptional regulator [Thermoleophilia bacterium]
MLIGRKGERATLDALTEGALHGNGAALLVTGEPGMGKTMLLDNAAERAQGGLTVLRASGRESDADLPFVVLAELLRPAEQELDELPGPQAQALRRALALEKDGDGIVDRLAVGVASLGVLATLAQQRPVLIVVDDLQWVDEPSRATILFVARRLSRLHIALLCAAREGELPEADARDLPRLELSGLRAREAGELLAGSARVPLDRAVRRRLLELSAGNPLALVELPAALSDAQLSGHDPLGEPIPVNGGIERTFGTRVARLPDRTRRALLLSATAGSDAGESVAAAFRQVELDYVDLDAAVHDGLVIVTAGNVAFRHPLVRSVVYHGESPTARRVAHALLADVEQDADRRAWHRASAAVAPDEVAAVELDAAAGRALARGAPASAARAFDAASRLSAEDEVRGKRLAYAARAAHRAGDVSSAGRYATAARQLASDPITLADLVLVESDLRMREGDLEGAHRALMAHAERLVETDRRRAATMLLLALKLRIFRLEGRAAADEVEHVLALLPAGEHDIVHLTALSMSRTVAGRDGARDSALAAAAAAARAPHGHAHTLGIAWPLIWLEEYDVAREVTDRATAIQREAGFLLYLPQSLLPQAELDFRTGRWEIAISAAAEALALFEETQQPTEAASAAAVLARMEAARGNGQECQALAQRALASDVEFGLRSSSAHALAALGLLALGSRRPEEAIAPLETTERILKLGAVGEPWLLLSAPDLVEALAHAGHEARALDVLRDFEARTEGMGRASASAAAARCAGILDAEGRWQDAFEEALALHAQVPTPFERARTELCYAERLRRGRKRADARARLHSALEVFDTLGAAPWSERARAELRASGETARRRSTPIDALTTQELAVAKLVVRGATNREAAAGLFVSPKTIEFHLGNVYRKLEVRSRTELVRTFSARLS